MKLRLVLNYELPISATAFSGVLEIVEESLWDAEFTIIRQLPEYFGSDFPFINRLFVQACGTRLREERDKGRLPPLLQIDAIRPGSLIFDGSVVAIGLWIVKNTLGESFKEAYKNSALNKRITVFFLLRQKDVLEWAAGSLRRTLVTRHSEARVMNIQKLQPEFGAHWLIVFIEIKKKIQAFQLILKRQTISIKVEANVP